MRSKLIRIVPPLWFILFVGLAFVAHYQIPSSHVFEFARTTYTTIAATIIVIGAWMITLRASNIFAIEKTEILPSSPSNRLLITRGPYRFSRNPMYLGMVIMILGLGVYFGTLPFFIAALAHFLVMNFVFIPYEEEKLSRIFGAEYETYRQKVRRWL